MAFVDDPNKSNSENVAGSAPLGQGSPAPSQTQSDSAPSQGASTPSTLQSSGSQQPQTRSKSGKASSGMFTNIQNYVQKNKPQAQKMSKAATDNFSNQAAEIRQATEAKKNQQQQAIAGNQAAMEDARNFASQQIQNVMNAPAQPAQAEAQVAQPADTQPVDNSQRFQDLMRGNIAGVNQVGNLDVTRENIKAQELSRLAQGAQTEAGRRQLLQDTFQKQNPYTRGMSSLDQLITSGDRDARESLITGVDQLGKDLNQDIATMKQQSQDALSAQQRDLQNFGQDITNMSQEAFTEVDDALQAAFDEEMANRQALGQNLLESSEDIEAWKAQKLAQLGDVEDFSNISQKLLDSGDLWRRGNNYFKYMAEGKHNFGVDPSSIYEGPMTARINENKFNQAIDNLIKEYTYGDDNLLDQISAGDARSQVWKGSNSSSKAKEDQFFRKDSIQDLFRDIKSRIEGLDSQDFIKQKFEKENPGQSYDDYIAGEGVDKYDLGSQQDIDRLKALQSLTGTGTFVDEMRDTDQVDVSSAEEFLNRYRK